MIYIQRNQAQLFSLSRKKLFIKKERRGKRERGEGLGEIEMVAVVAFELGLEERLELAVMGGEVRA